MEPMERRTKRTLIRYKTRPELAEKNAQLIASVFKRLEAAKPDGVRYVSLRLYSQRIERDVLCSSFVRPALPSLASGLLSWRDDREDHSWD